jgi:hypothetical protein
MRPLTLRQELGVRKETWVKKGDPPTSTLSEYPFEMIELAWRTTSSPFITSSSGWPGVSGRNQRHADRSRGARGERRRDDLAGGAQSHGARLHSCILSTGSSRPRTDAVQCARGVPKICGAGAKAREV